MSDKTRNSETRAAEMAAGQPRVNRFIEQMSRDVASWPPLPTDDKRDPRYDPLWHHMWVRASIGQDEDVKNIRARQTGMLPYEATPAAELPHLAGFASASGGEAGGYIRYKDVVAMRCPREDYEDYQAAVVHKAMQMENDIKATAHGLRNKNGQKVVKVVEDNESEGQYFE